MVNVVINTEGYYDGVYSYDTPLVGAVTTETLPPVDEKDIRKAFCYRYIDDECEWEFDEEKYNDLPPIEIVPTIEEQLKAKDGQIASLEERIEKLEALLI